MPGHAPGLYLIRTDAWRALVHLLARRVARAPAAVRRRPRRAHPRRPGRHGLAVPLGDHALAALRPAHDRLLGVLDALVAAASASRSTPTTARPGGPTPGRPARMQDVLVRTALALPTLDDEEALHGDADWRDTMRRLERLGVQEAAVKLGAEGAVVLADGAVEQVPAAPDVEVVDTTGAGDAFDAGYLHGRLAGLEPAAAAAERRAPGGRRARPSRRDPAGGRDARAARLLA